LKLSLQGSQLSLIGLCLLTPLLAAPADVMYADLEAFQFGFQLFVFLLPVITAPKKESGQHPGPAAETIQFNNVSVRRRVPHLTTLEYPEKPLSQRAVAQQK
jgi:hypothetical protein